MTVEQLFSEMEIYARAINESELSLGLYASPYEGVISTIKQFERNLEAVLEELETRLYDPATMDLFTRGVTIESALTELNAKVTPELAVLDIIVESVDPDARSRTAITDILNEYCTLEAGISLIEESLQEFLLGWPGDQFAEKALLDIEVLKLTLFLNS